MLTHRLPRWTVALEPVASASRPALGRPVHLPSPTPPAEVPPDTSRPRYYAAVRTVSSYPEDEQWGCARLVRIIWPKSQQVDVWCPGADQPAQTLSTRDQLDGLDALPGFSLPVAELFA